LAPWPDFDVQPAANTANTASTVQNRRDGNFISSASPQIPAPEPARSHGCHYLCGRL